MAGYFPGSGRNNDVLWPVSHLRQPSQSIFLVADGFVSPGQANVTIQINQNEGTPEIVEGWKQDGKWILTSTLQKGVYFSSPESAAKSLLIGKKKLLPPEKKE